MQQENTQLQQQLKEKNDKISKIEKCTKVYYDLFEYPALKDILDLIESEWLKDG